MKPISFVAFLAVALASGCGLEPDEPEVAETEAALEIVGGPIFVRPFIGAISPTAAAPGATVTITGGGFDLMFRGPAGFGSSTDLAAQSVVTYVSPTELRVVVPAGARQGPIYLISAITVIGRPPGVLLTSAQTFTPLVPPAAPSGLTATVVSSSRVDLTWVDSSWNEVDFDVWAYDATAGWRSVRTAPANATSASVTGLLPSTAYSFKVRARNGTGNSPYSNVRNATTRSNRGTLVLINDAQVSLQNITLNNQNPSSFTVSGNTVTFDLVAGTYTVRGSLRLANTREVCPVTRVATDTEGQSLDVRILALTAGQVLTHCSGSAVYDGGSYIDNNFVVHSVSVTVFANGGFDVFIDGFRNPFSIATTSFAEPFLTFTLNAGDEIIIGWPFDAMQLADVNGHGVQLLRVGSW
jgi:hypothetical protein